MKLESPPKLSFPIICRRRAQSKKSWSFNKQEFKFTHSVQSAWPLNCYLTALKPQFPHLWNRNTIHPVSRGCCEQSYMRQCFVKPMPHKQPSYLPRSSSQHAPSECLFFRPRLSVQPLPRHCSKWWNFKQPNKVQRVEEMQALRGGYFGPRSQSVGPALRGILPPGQLPLALPRFHSSFPSPFAEPIVPMEFFPPDSHGHVRETLVPYGEKGARTP